MSEFIKLTTGDNRTRPNTEIKNLLTNFNEVISGKKPLDDLAAFIANAVQYVSMCPTAYENPLPRSENECIKKIMSLLNSRANLQDGLMPGEIFQEHYNEASEGINDPRMRDLLANLLLSGLQDESQYMMDDMGLMPFNNNKKFSNNSNSKNFSNGSTNNGSSINGNGNGNGNVKFLVPCMKSYDPIQRDIGLGSQLMPNYMLELSRMKNVDISHDVVQNALYSFTGAQGKYLKKDVITGRFKLDPQNVKHLNNGQSAMLLRLSELGYFHDQISKFANVSTGYNAMGCMGQAFISKLKLELNEFHGQVADLHDQLQKYRQTQLQDFGDRQQSWLKRPGKPITLLKLLKWYIAPLHRMQWLTKVANACQLKKGGELASVVYGFLKNGDPMVDQLASDLLTVCCTPLVRMISKWMLEGGINDIYGEFFIESLPEVGADRLWHDKFRLRLNMLPKFISLELADKILKTGKSINFLREICQIDEAVKGREELHDIIDNHVSQIFSFVPDTNWHSAIETCYSQTSKHVLDIMVGPHKLLVHLQGMRRYLLLGQGDFVSIFIDNIKDELAKQGTDIYSHDLSSKLDAALRCTNAQYDDPEILNHLDVVLKTAYSGDCGWDVISLQYTVRGPLATMLEPAMPTYKTLFRPLWRMKHMEFVLTTKIWKEQMGNAKALRALSSEIGKATYRLNLFTSEIMHFVHQMQYYVLFEVIECSWVELQKRVQQAEALDEILDAHSKFLNAISIGCFVKSSKNVVSNLEVVYETIIQLLKIQSQFYDDCFQELSARQQMAKTISESEKTGRYGLTTVQKIERDQECKIFEQKVVSFCRVLNDFANTYGKSVGAFLLALNSSTDPNLQLFGTRLDFNEYYKKRDTNLSKPLTFEHMRMSNVMGNSKSLTAGKYSMYPHPSAAQFGLMNLD